MQINENTFKRMPAHLQSLFAKLPNPGREEVLAHFPHSKSGSMTAAQQAKGGFAGTVNAYGKAKAGGSSEYKASEGNASRFFYCAKTSKRERNEGLDHMEPKRGGSEVFDKSNRDGLGEQRQPMNANIHPTVKPTDLMSYLCRLVTPPKGIVLDPFMGSGSTGKAAIREGFYFMGCDISPEYFEIAKARIEYEVSKLTVAPIQPDLNEYEIPSDATV